MALTMKQKRTFDFLLKNAGITVTLAEITVHSRFTESTIKTYLNKKLNKYLVEFVSSDKYKILDTVKNIDKDDFAYRMSQKARYLR